MSALNDIKKVLELEANSILNVVKLLDAEACNRLEALFKDLIRANGQIIFCGVGKSGLIAQKLSSTFASLGLRSIFLHPTEALHGDLGRVRNDDAIVLLSKSGNTEEIVKLIPFLRIKREKIVGLLGNTKNEIASKCGIVMNCYVEKEACINNLAPTTSSTVALAMGDAMAVLYERVVSLSKEGFAINHPGGILGKSLVMKVRDLMWDQSKSPILKLNQTLKDAILEMTKNPVGACAVINDNNELLGILVEGDIRRNLAKSENAMGLKMSEIMTKKPVIIDEDALALDALTLMENKDRQVYVLAVVGKGKFKGFIRMHDLLKEGFSK